MWPDESGALDSGRVAMVEAAGSRGTAEVDAQAGALHAVVRRPPHTFVHDLHPLEAQFAVRERAAPALGAVQQ